MKIKHQILYKLAMAVLLFWVAGCSIIVDTTPVVSTKIWTASPTLWLTETSNSILDESPTPGQTPMPTNTSTPFPTITSTTTPGRLQFLITDDFGVSMALVPAGSFEMGSNAEDPLPECRKYRKDCDPKWFEDEEPVHPVFLEEFYIDQYEVTNARYAECVNANACDPPWDHSSYKRQNYFHDPDFADYPVIYVNWEDAQAYCQWRGARLPSEAEWEKAARGGLESKLFSWGNILDGTLANYCDVSCNSVLKGDDFIGDDFDDGYEDTAPVGSYPPNGYGLYDMTGNVSEWTADWYELYPGNIIENDFYFGELFRVSRGGSWRDVSFNLRVADRQFDTPLVVTN